MPSPADFRLGSSSAPDLPRMKAFSETLTPSQKSLGLAISSRHCRVGSLCRRRHTMEGWHRSARFAWRSTSKPWWPRHQLPRPVMPFASNEAQGRA